MPRRDSSTLLPRHGVMATDQVTNLLKASDLYHRVVLPVGIFVRWSHVIEGDDDMNFADVK